MRIQRTLILAAAVLVFSSAGCSRTNEAYDKYTEAGALFCLPGERQCNSQMAQVCIPTGGDAQWSYVDERKCPGGSSCDKGFCVPAGNKCDSNAQCTGSKVCTIFVEPSQKKTLVTYCATKVGTKTGGQTCSEHNQCDTGSCLGQGSARECFRACGGGSCPKGTTCSNLTVTVHGVKGAIKACVTP